MTTRPHLRVVGAWMKITNPRRIALARQKAGYTQADLAQLVRCSQAYISLIERGLDNDCSERIAIALCKRLDLDLEDVFEEREIFEAPKNPSPKAGNSRRKLAA